MSSGNFEFRIADFEFEENEEFQSDRLPAESTSRGNRDPTLFLISKSAIRNSKFPRHRTVTEKP